MIGPEQRPLTDEDVDTMLTLINEYAARLRTLSSEYLTYTSRRNQAFTVLLFSVIATMALSYPTLSAMNSDPTSRVALITILVAAASAVIAILVILFGRNAARLRDSFEAQQLASTLERLIRIASQYSEHAALRVGRSFEFELRLADAEASLRAYQNVFDDHRSSSSTSTLTASVSTAVSGTKVGAIVSSPQENDNDPPSVSRVPPEHRS